MVEKAPALYILQKRIKPGRTLILERNIQALLHLAGKVSLYFYKGRAQPVPSQGPWERPFLILPVPFSMAENAPKPQNA